MVGGAPNPLDKFTSMIFGIPENDRSSNETGEPESRISVRLDWFDVLSLLIRRIPVPVREWMTRLAFLAMVFWLLLKLGLDVPFMMQWAGFLLAMTPHVILIAMAGLALAVPIAVALTLARLSMSPVARGSAGMFVSIVRGIPLIVLLFFFFIALPQMASLGPDWLYQLLILSPTLTAILAIGFFHAAYISELFRAGFLSVPLGQWEAASAIGMSASQTKRRIIWPQAMKFALRPVTNHFVMMLKDTALVGFLGVPVLFQRAERIGSQNLKMFETILIAALVYWALTVISWKLIDFMDRRVQTR